MKFSTHESDLYVLPETQRERHQLRVYCQSRNIGYEWSYSDVEGQAWHGKQFMDIPFRSDLIDDIKVNI